MELCIRYEDSKELAAGPDGDKKGEKKDKWRVSECLPLKFLHVDSNQKEDSWMDVIIDDPV